ncbi:hypothetical protein BGX31_010930 [Mortierella sp. GBA43]|nr:hypothetical protein BGX31_010930 [Mortierella sp. GBA43]
MIPSRSASALIAALILTRPSAGAASHHSRIPADDIPILKAPEAFHEQLVLKPMADGSVYTHFQFTTHLGTMQDDEHYAGAASNLFTHYNLFPRSIGQVLHSFDVEELHLTFTQGRWQYSDWGYPLAPSAGTGVELWAWLKDDNHHIEPRMSFRNEGLYNVHGRSHSNSNFNSTGVPRKLRYGSLPHENVCTENLTPWIKLLPCKSKAGIASLLKSHKLFDSRFYSMAIHVRPMCEDELCRVRSLELVQTITTVFDVARNDGSYDWTLTGLFEREITLACPLASTSNVVLHLPQTTQFPNQYEFVPMPEQSIQTIGSKDNLQEIAVYNLKTLHGGSQQASSPFQLSFRWENSRPKSTRPITPGIVAHRYFTGFGQEHGGLAIEIHNNNQHDIEALLLDTLPWYLKLYLHTFSVEVNGQALKNQKDVVKKMFYQQAADRSRPAVLELGLNLPAQSLVKLTLDFDKVFLKYTEHRPDANRGFDVGYAVITVSLPRQQGQIGFGGLDYLRIYQERDASLVQSYYQENNSKDDQGALLGTDKIRVYTETLLVSLPTPDFSMPYNVITLTCTVIALFFGSIFNLMTRNFEVVEPAAPKKDE